MKNLRAYSRTLVEATNMAGGQNFQRILGRATRLLSPYLLAILLVAIPAISTSAKGFTEDADDVAVENVGWIDLTVSSSAQTWQAGHADWTVAGDAKINLADPKALVAKPGKGVLISSLKERLEFRNLVSQQWWGDLEVSLQVLIPQNSNAGVKLQGLYEIQITDSHGKEKLTGDDCGGIYPRAEGLPRYHTIDKGVPPSVNAARPAGQWQTLQIVFQAPRFDAEGKKTDNARFVKVTLNGKVVQQNIELKWPTGHAWRTKQEVPLGPLFLQGDHGPVAYRNVRVRVPSDKFSGLQEINSPAVPAAGTLQAIVGATLIDGRGGTPVQDSVVVVRDNKIIAVGVRSAVEIPEEANLVDATGLTLLPGLVDSHFHIGKGAKRYDLPPLFLSHGVTSARDPGRPIEVYSSYIKSSKPAPRLFLCGPHFDQEPPAWPHNAILLETPSEAKQAVKRYFQQGASAIKVYFRLPLELIEATCTAAHDLGIPVTAHLELVDADKAIDAGLDGVEHITSFGTALASRKVADRFRTLVGADNEAREIERYRLWATLDLDKSPRVGPLLETIVAHNVFVSPTLAVFERRTGDKKATDLAHIRGFQNMLKFTGMCDRAGATVVVGSHTWVPHADLGWAFQREMELLVEAGMKPMKVIGAATLQNARFLGCADRVGSLEPGKLADLVLVDGDPLDDIHAMYNIKRVMLNGRWVEMKTETVFDSHSSTNGFASQINWISRTNDSTSSSVVSHEHINRIPPSPIKS